MGTGPCPVYKRGKREEVSLFLLPQDHGDHGGGCTQHRHGTQCDIQVGVAVGGLVGVRCVGGGVGGGDGGSTGAACGGGSQLRAAGGEGVGLAGGHGRRGEEHEPGVVHGFVGVDGGTVGGPDGEGAALGNADAAAGLAIHLTGHLAAGLAGVLAGCLPSGSSGGVPPVADPRTDGGGGFPHVLLQIRDLLQRRYFEKGGAFQCLILSSLRA